MKPLTTLSVIVFLCMGPAASVAEPAPQEAALSVWDGVWAPQPRAPGRDGRGPGAGRRARGDGGEAALRRGGPPPGGGGRVTGSARLQVSEEDAAKGLEPTDMMIRSSMTAAGRAKFDEFDPLDLPSANCQSSGLPGIAVIPQLQEWRVMDGALVIRHESHDVERVVDLDGSAPAAGNALSVLGVASGRLDGETLVIDTTNLAAGWGGLGRNAPGSDQRTVRETYRLVDHDTIEGEIVITDPKYLTRDLRVPVVLKRQPEGTQIEPFPCDVEVARRHLAGD